MDGSFSRAHRLFDQITNSSDPTRLLKECVDQHRSEDDFLEFKGAGKIKDAGVKEHWSQALSGFANTEGGVLVWGIRAASIHGRNVDAAIALDLAPDPEALKQQLKDVALAATVDPVPGVRLEHYCVGQNTREGFVVCLVPEGPRKPYRAEMHPMKQYYQRVLDRFCVIPHPLLRSLFYPRSFPAFSVTISHRSRSTEMSNNDPRTSQWNSIFDMFIENTGTASARELFITLGSSGGQRGFGANGFNCFGVPHGVGQYALSYRSLHPKERLKCLDCFINYPRQSHAPVTFEITAYATDCEPLRGLIEFTAPELESTPSKSISLSGLMDQIAGDAKVVSSDREVNC